MNLNIALALALPFLACAVQWLLWDAWIAPYVWFLFFPAAFFSAWLGGLRGGLGGTVIGALLVWYVFIPPRFEFELANPASIASIVLFVIMGGLFAWFFERLYQARRRTDEALAETRAANVRISDLYRKTLELDELKGQFFANVSHELRTPLTLIMAPLARRLGQAGADDPARREDETMLRNARQLYRHVADLLDAARIEAGGLAVEYAHVDLAELTRAMASHFDSAARERGIDLRVETPGELSAEVDGGKVQRILLNLLSNAFKFVPDGGRIEVRLGVSGERVILEVRNNGPGIPADRREAAFERFRQLDGGSGRRHGGTGLGLSIAREFAELHGGRIDVTDTPGGGAWFIVALPSKAPEGTELHDSPAEVDPVIRAEALDALHRPPATRGEPDTRALPLILVVEDNADMGEFIAGALRRDYRVTRAGNGREGLAAARAERPDLILSDVMMPDMSGDEMVLALHEDAELAALPVVLLTARADDDLRVKMLQAGVRDYLNKPFTVEELRARVDGLIAGSRRAEEQLRAIETRFEATFEQAAVGIALVAPDGHWLKVNRKLCAIVGYTPEELMSKTFQDITHPDDLDADLGQVRRMLARDIDSYAMEKRYFRKDGSLVWINLTVSLISKPDGSPDYFISVVEDISARKTAEAEVLASQDRLREARRLAGLGHWYWNLVTNVHRWSEEIYAFYGRDPALPPAEYPEVQGYFTPESWAELSAAVEQGMATGRPYECDAEVVRPDGSHRWITARGQATRDADGKVVALYGTVQDISERKRAELELKRRNEELERFDRAATGRELRMIALKGEVNSLARELGRAPPYELSFASEAKVAKS